MKGCSDRNVTYLNYEAKEEERLAQKVKRPLGRLELWPEEIMETCEGWLQKQVDSGSS